MIAILIIAALVGCVWTGVIFLRGGLVCGSLAVLIAGSCFGYLFFHVRASPIPVTSDRILWIFLIVQYVLWRFLGRTDPKPMGWPEWLLAALGIALLMTTFLHDWRTDNSQPVASLLFYYLMPIGIYWVAREASVSKRDVLIVFGVLSVFGIYLAITAIAEMNEISWLIYPKYIASTDFLDHLGRGRGPFMNSSACGLFQGTCLCALLMWWPRLGRPGQLALLAAIALSCIGIYCTLTRCSWMGGFLGLVLIVYLTIPRNARVLLVSGSLLAIGLLLVTQWDRLVAFKRDRGGCAQDTFDSAKLRPILALVAWKMSLDRPLLGHGFGQYNEAKGNYLSDRNTTLPLEKSRPYHQHNVFLALLTETGLLGMGAFVGLLTLWTWDAWKLVRRRDAPLWVRQQGLLFIGLIANYLANGMFQDVAIMPSVHMLVFLLAGITAALRPWTEPAREPVPEVATRFALAQ